MTQIELSEKFKSQMKRLNQMKRLKTQERGLQRMSQRRTR